jgi:flagellar hook-basal body complex protein FliE
MVNLNPNVTSVAPKIESLTQNVNNGPEDSEFSKAVKAVGKYISDVDQQQKATDVTIQDLLTGKSEDIISVVSEAAKADMSFKLLVGVRNKLIEAYKQTMNMPL